MNLKYYLYCHITKDSNEIFYIGIGTKPKRYNTHAIEYKRAYDSCSRSRWWKNMANKHGRVVNILIESDDIEIIGEMEVFYISVFGRKDIGNGILVNQTNGGDGPITRGQFNHTQETRNLIREKHRGRKITKEHLFKLNEGRRNQIITEEMRENYRRSHLGKRPSEESRLKNSIAHSGGNHPKARKIMRIDTGIVYDTIKEAAKDHGLHYYTLLKYLNGNIKAVKYDAHKKFSFV